MVCGRTDWLRWGTHTQTRPAVPVVSVSSAAAVGTQQALNCPVFWAAGGRDPCPELKERWIDTLGPVLPAQGLGLGSDRAV